MKKILKYYLIIWTVVLVFFNVISFVSISLSVSGEYTASFWSGYILITITFIGQLVCSYYALKNDDIKKTFYNISFITTSYSGLVLSFVLGSLCMIVSSLPYWIGIVLCLVVLSFNVITLIKAKIAVEIVSSVDERINKQTFFIKMLTADMENLIIKAKNEEIKKVCKKLYEIVRYSDPMSNEALSSIENDIKIKFIKFSDSVVVNNAEATNEIANELIILLNDRNTKCRLLK